jgi:hypothetical protein
LQKTSAQNTTSVIQNSWWTRPNLRIL